MSRENYCPLCRSETARSTLDEIEGREGELEVKVHGLPVLECPKGHRVFVRPDFPVQLLRHLVDEDEPELPASATTGLLFKEHVCSSCGSKLEPADREHTFHVDVALPESEPFDVELTMPVHHCASCGKEQLHSLKEIRKRTPEALANAFRGASIAAPRPG